MLYQLKNLLKVYDQRSVLDLRDLSLEQGKVIGLLGPNGAGKTTLLEVMAFLLPPTSGEIWFKKERVDFSIGKLISLRRKVVLVQQQPILFTTTVSRNVEFPLKIRKISKATREKTVEELLELVGMERFRHVRANELSGGETHRVAVARALACSPEVILLDEPMGSVDVENQGAIERIIQDMNQAKGISVILTSHDMIQISRLVDDTIFLFEGKVAKTIYENIFSGLIESRRDGRKYCVLKNGKKLIVRSEKSGQVRISIDPGGVKISKKGSPSEENAFRGRVIQLSEEQSQVRALIDVEIPLNALIPKESFRSLNLGMGEDVWLTCPVESIDVF